MSFSLVGGLDLGDRRICIGCVLSAMISGERNYFDGIWIDRDLKRIWVDHIYTEEFTYYLPCDIQGDSYEGTIKYYKEYKVMLIL